MSYPYAELVLCSGFFIIYLIEAAVQKIFNIQSHSHGIPAGLIHFFCFENFVNLLSHKKPSTFTGANLSLQSNGSVAPFNHSNHNKKYIK